MKVSNKTAIWLALALMLGVLFIVLPVMASGACRGRPVPEQTQASACGTTITQQPDCTEMQCGMMGKAGGCGMPEGPAKAALDAYAKDTVGLRLDLAEARASLAAAIGRNPIDQREVAELTSRISHLQGQLFSRGVQAVVALRQSVPAEQIPKCFANTMGCGCAMMFVDQRPMRGNGAQCGAKMGGCPMMAGQTDDMRCYCCGAGMPAK